jgi:hypothetical protein
MGASGFGLGISALVLLPLEAALFISPCSEPFAGLAETTGAISSSAAPWGARKMTQPAGVSESCRGF